MTNITLILTITGIHVLALISPGPDFIMAINNSLRYSRKTGIFTAVGFGLGIGVHILYCIAGLALLISQSIIIFNTIKLLGAGYLIYIGIQALRSKSSHIETTAVKQHTDLSAIAALRIGFLTNVLNPKATLFFLSLFTMVLAPSTPSIVLFILSIIMIVNTMLWFSFVAIVLTQAKVQVLFHKSTPVFNKVLGSLLIALGIKVALVQR